MFIVNLGRVSSFKEKFINMYQIFTLIRLDEKEPFVYLAQLVSS